MTEETAPVSKISPVSALRDELQRRQLDGFVVPHSDEHQGEYIALASERLAWVTGFNGSAGMSVILKDRAAVFVDGRYTIQVEEQVDKETFERCHLTDHPVSDWLTANVPSGAKVGFDPWLHTPTQIAAFRTACERAGGELIAVEGNPVDAVWSDRPALPLGPAVPQAENFTGWSSADKRQTLAQSIQEGGTDAVVLTAPDSIAWLLNVRGADVPYSPLPLSFALLHSSGEVDWFIDSRKLAPELADHLGPDVHTFEPDQLGPALDQLGGNEKTVRLDPNTQAAWIFDRLKQAGAAIVHGVDPCQLPKAKKTTVELDGIRAAHVRDGAAVVQFLAWLAEAAPTGGINEISAADKLETFRRGGNSFRGLSFPTISGAGPNGAITHYNVTEETCRELLPGSLYLVDSGGQYLDGTTDITRTIAVGEPAEEMRQCFTLVLKGHIALGSSRFPTGTTGSQLDVLARRALWEHGLDYDHGTGHGVGSYLNVHEGPHRISKVPNRVPLEPGMVVSNEPGYYKAGEFGIRIENLVAVVKTNESGANSLLGFETLSLAPIDQNLINPDLMTADEISWLDAYHQRVRETIGPLVDGKTLDWLASATKPIA